MRYLVSYQHKLKPVAQQVWREDDGVLSFEWVLLLSLVTIGIVSGLSTVRDGIIEELNDAAQATLALDQSFSINSPLVSFVHSADSTTASDSGYFDSQRFEHCVRIPPPN